MCEEKRRFFPNLAQNQKQIVRFLEIPKFSIFPKDTKSTVVTYAIMRIPVVKPVGDAMVKAVFYTDLKVIYNYVTSILLAMQNS